MYPGSELFGDLMETSAPKHQFSEKDLAFGGCV